MPRPRQLIQFAFNLAAAASLALCVATVALWVLGCRREPGVRGAYLSGTYFYAQITTYNHILSFDVAAGRHWPQLRATYYPRLGSEAGLVRRGEYGSKLVSDLPPLPLNMASTGVTWNGEMWLTGAPTVR